MYFLFMTGSKKHFEKKIEKLGFEKVYESDLYVEFERYIKEYNYTQVLAFLHKATGNHLIQSFEKGTDDAVGISFKEMEICLQYAKKLGW